MEGNINEAIEQISEKLGLAITDISQLMPQFVKQQVIFSSISSGISLIVFIVSILAIIIGIKRDKNVEKKYDLISDGIRKGIVTDTPRFISYSDLDDDFGVTLFLTGLVASIISGLVLCCMVSNLIKWSIAPEFNFFEYILKLI